VRIFSKVAQLSINLIPLQIYYKVKLKWLLYFEKNPLINESKGIYSQNEEDYILAQIINTIGNVPKVFIEFGPGNGLQNNTLHLLMQKYHGTWIGNEVLLLDNIIYKKIKYIQIQVSLENLDEIIAKIKKEKTGVISVDLDGNDFYIVKRLLQEKSTLPEIFIVEYNSFYSLKSEFIMDYNSQHVWDGSNNFGASLLSYKKLFKEFNYFLCAVNLTGTNAFFIKNEHKDKFIWQFENSDKLFRKQFKYYKEFRKPIDASKINRKLVKAFKGMM